MTRSQHTGGGTLNDLRRPGPAHSGTGNNGEQRARGPECFLCSAFTHPSPKIEQHFTGPMFGGTCQQSTGSV